MTHRFVVPLALVLAMILTACTSGESESGQPGIDSISSTAPDEDVGPSDSSDELIPIESAPPRGSDVIFDGSAGAEEAAAAVSGLLASINSGDILGALAHIDPAERDLIADLYLTVVDASVAAWPQFEGTDAIDGLGIEVLPLSQLRTTLYSDHLAWVETDEVEFYMAAPTEVAAAFFSEQEPWGPGSGYDRDDIAHREDDWSGLTYLFGPSSDVLPGLMVAEVDGRWYVSFGRTMLELLRIDAEFETEFPVAREVVHTTPSLSPEEAVVNLLAAVADDRMAAAAGHLVSAEGQAFADYPALLDHWLPGLLDVDVELEPTSLRVVHRANGRAVVEAPQLTLSVVGAEHDEGVFDPSDVNFKHEVQLADQCLTVNDLGVWCEPIETDASTFTSIYRDLGWDGLRLVTVLSEGGWSVSLYESLAHYGLPLASDPLYGLGYNQSSLPAFGGPLSYTLINETAKTLPLQTSDTIALEPHARDRLLIARFESSDEGRVLHFDPSTLERECFITIWNIDMVTDDWGEEPEYYDTEYCDDHVDRPLEIPPGVELTLTLWSYGGELEPVVAELR